MTEANPRYQWGQRVQAAVELFNDGTFPDHPAGALLVSKGELGEVLQVGQYTESGDIVYMVEFALNKVVGCFEPELTPYLHPGGTL